MMAIKTLIYAIHNVLWPLMNKPNRIQHIQQNNEEGKKYQGNRSLLLQFKRNVIR